MAKVNKKIITPLAKNIKRHKLRLISQETIYKQNNHHEKVNRETALAAGNKSATNKVLELC